MGRVYLILYWYMYTKEYYHHVWCIWIWEKKSNMSVRIALDCITFLCTRWNPYSYNIYNHKEIYTYYSPWSLLFVSQFTSNWRTLIDTRPASLSIGHFNTCIPGCTIRSNLPIVCTIPYSVVRIHVRQQHKPQNGAHIGDVKHSIWCGIEIIVCHSLLFVFVCCGLCECD